MTEILITRTKDEPGATTLSVEAPVEVVRAAEKKAAGNYAKRVKLPGFPQRKGSTRGRAQTFRRRHQGDGDSGAR